MCHTLVSPSSYDENAEVCVICSILSDAQKVVPEFPEGFSPPLFQEFKDSQSKKHRFDSSGLRWREKKSSAQDAQFMREWRRDKNSVRLVHYYLVEHFYKLRTNRKTEDDIELRYSQVSSSLFYVYIEILHRRVWFVRRYAWTVTASSVWKAPTQRVYAGRAVRKSELPRTTMRQPMT
jgi:hypothetical protein